MNENRDDDRAWSRPGSVAQPPSHDAAPTLPPSAGSKPVPPAQPRTGIERWQTIAALLILPVPLAFYALIGALISGAIAFPDPFDEPCTKRCLALRDDVRAAYTDPAACDGSGPRLCFVPIGSVSSDDLEALTRYYKSRYGIDAKVLPGIDLDARLLDAEVGQVFAPQLLSLMTDRYGRDSDPGRTLIGITTVDMFITGERAATLFDFALAYYRSDVKAGIVSTAEMRPKIFWFELESGNAGELRLQKQVNVLVGVLHFRLPPSFNPGSAVYYDVSSPWTLDRMPADLPVPRP